LGRESNPTIRLVCKRKCRLGERIKSQQKKMQAWGENKKMHAWGENQIPPSGWYAEENTGLRRESNLTIRLVCRRKCRLGERINQVGKCRLAGLGRK